MAINNIWEVCFLTSHYTILIIASHASQIITVKFREVTAWLEYRKLETITEETLYLQGTPEQRACLFYFIFYYELEDIALIVMNS